jgi:hypothetical protein
MRLRGAERTGYLASAVLITRVSSTRKKFVCFAAVFIVYFLFGLLLAEPVLKLFRVLKKPP